MSEQLDLDAPITGAINIAREAGWFTRDGEPNAHKVYYKHEHGLLVGLVVKNGRELISSRRQIQRLATTSRASKNVKSNRTENSPQA